MRVCLLLLLLRLIAAITADKNEENRREEEEVEECLAIPTVKLHNGVEMPLLQLGTAQLVTQPGIDADVHKTFVGMLPERANRQIELALTNGLRAFDTAYIYRSSTAIGSVLAEWFRTGRLDSRRRVWLATKVFHPDATSQTFRISHMPDLPNMTPSQVAERTLEHFERNLVQLGVGYVDLLLLHWPSGKTDEQKGSINNDSSVEWNRQQRIAAWKVLEEIYSKGWARAIGVSNFAPTHIQQLKQDGATIVPMVNQIEASVTLQYREIVEYCLANDIVPQAYSPFGRGLSQLPDALNVLATKYQKNSGQIAIRYLVQLGYSVVYLSNSEEHMVTNTEVFDFELSDSEVEQLNALNEENGGWGLPSPLELD